MKNLLLIASLIVGFIFSGNVNLATAKIFKAPELRIPLKRVDYSKNLHLNQTDIEIHGPEGSLKFSRHFNPLGVIPHSLGFGWSHNYEYNGTFLGGSKQFYFLKPGGKVEVFQKEETSQRYILQNSQEGILEIIESGMRISYADKMELFFDENGELVEIKSIHNPTTKLRYSNGKLIEIYNELGWFIGLEYDSSGNLIAATASNGDRIDYDYRIRAVKTYAGITHFNYLSLVVKNGQVIERYQGAPNLKKALNKINPNLKMTWFVVLYGTSEQAYRRKNAKEMNRISPALELVVHEDPLFQASHLSLEKKRKELHTQLNIKFKKHPPLIEKNHGLLEPEDLQKLEGMLQGALKN